MHLSFTAAPKTGRCEVVMAKASGRTSAAAPVATPEEKLPFEGMGMLAGSILKPVRPYLRPEI